MRRNLPIEGFSFTEVDALSFDNFSQLGNFLPGFVRAGNRFGDTALYVSFEYVCLDRGQSLLRRLKLIEDINTILALVDEPNNTAKLPFSALEPGDLGTVAGMFAHLYQPRNN